MAEEYLSISIQFWRGRGGEESCEELVELLRVTVGPQSQAGDASDLLECGVEGVDDPRTGKSSLPWEDLQELEVRCLGQLAEGLGLLRCEFLCWD